MKNGLAVLVVLLSASAALALDPSKSIDQYVHTRWTTEDGLPQNSIKDIVQTRDGYLWIATTGGLARFDSVDFRVFDIATDEIGSNFLSALYEDGEGTLWIGSVNSIVSTWRDGVFTSFEPGQNLGHGKVLRFREDGDDLWIDLDRATVRWRRGSEEIDISPRPAPATGGGVALRDRDGNFWHSEGAELHRLSPEGECSTFTAGSEIISLLEDDEGNLWFGTSQTGLERFHDGAFIAYNAAHGFTDSIVVSIVEAADGAIWFASRGDGYFRFRDRRFTRVPLPKSFERGQSLLRDSAGRIWLGANGFACWDDGKLTAIHRGETLPGNGVVSALYEDRQGRIWIGMEDGGLGVLDEGGLRFYNVEDGLVDDEVRFITEGRRETLWIGTFRGMSRFAGGGFRNYTMADGLPYDYVRAIHEDEAGILWLGTYGGGLARLADGEVTTRYSTGDGLPENIVSRILEDDHGNFWLSGNRGVTRVRRESLEELARGESDTVAATLYGPSDGMSVSETYGGVQPAGWKASDGRLWFPMAQGTVVVDPASLRPLSAPPTYIERFLVNGQEQRLEDEVVVPPGMSELEVHFTAIQHALPREVRFQYRLRSDEPWTTVGNERKVHFSRQPGEYRFEVRAAAYTGGAWGDSRSIQLTLEAQWWQTPWAKLGLILAVLAVGYLAGKRHVRAQARIAAQRQLESEREQLLEEIDANQALQARIQALEELGARSDGEVAGLARSLARQEQLYAKLLRAESPAHLAALRDELAGIAEDAGEMAVLNPDFLKELHQVLKGLEPLERLPAGEDRTLVLGEALTRAMAMQEHIERRGAEPALGGMALDSVLQIFSTALQDVQQRAELNFRLRSKKVTVRRDAMVVLEVRNDGQGIASNVTVRLQADESALDVRRSEQGLKSLRRGQAALLEFLVEPRESERVRLAFHVAYDDPERAGKTLEFADVMELRRYQDRTFRPLHPNPYVVGRPLLDSDLFFGREELFTRLARSLQGSRQDNVIILIGQRRMGKTSILRRLGNHLPDVYVPVLVDLQGLLGSGEAAFFAELVAQVVDELAERGLAVREPPPAALANDPGRFFRRQFLPDVRRVLDGRRLLLLFDEMEVIEERIRAGELTPKILPYLRSLMQHEEDVSFLLAGSHRLDEMTADYWSVLFNLALYLHVGHLSEDDVRALFTEPTRDSFEVDPLALDKVFRTTGGHPHFSQLLARELVDFCNRKKISYVTIQDVNEITDVVIEKGQLHFAYLWDGASPTERRLLLAVRDLLNSEGIASLRSVRRYLRERGQESDLRSEEVSDEVAKAARRLQRKQILTEEAGQLSFRIDLLRRWLERHQDLGSEKLSEVPT